MDGFGETGTEPGEFFFGCDRNIRYDLRDLGDRTIYFITESLKSLPYTF